MSLVSVIMPAFNVHEYIYSSIQSVLNQSYKNIELIVIDDCSTDSTAQIVKNIISADARVRYLSTQYNSRGPALPRNIGVSAANGDWIAFVDSDDLWHPNKIELQLNALYSQKLLMCSSEILNFNQTEDIIWAPINNDLDSCKISFNDQLKKYRTPTSSIIVHKKLINYLIFNTDSNLIGREDTDCFTRIHEHINCSLKIIYPLVRYRIHSSQISKNKFKMLFLHFKWLKSYRQINGKSLGIMAYIYLLTNFILSIYYRFYKKSL